MRQRAGDVDKLAFCVRSLIVQAASSRAVGMSAQDRCVFKHERSRKGPMNLVWFDWECWEKRKVYGIPAGMYASQVWGTVYLSEGSEFGIPLCPGPAL